MNEQGQLIVETHNFVKKGSISFADVLKMVQQKILSEQVQGFVTLQKAPSASVQNSARENPVQLAQNVKKVSLEGFNPLTIEKKANDESAEGKVQNDVDHSLKVPVKDLPTSQGSEEESNQSEPQIKKDLPTGQSSTIEPKIAERSENEPEQSTTKVQKVHPKAQHFVSNPDILNATVSKQNELVQNGNESTRTQSTDQGGKAQRSVQSQNVSNVTSVKQTNQGEQITQISEFSRAQDVHQTTQQNQYVLNDELLRRTQRNEQTGSKIEEQNGREKVVETSQRSLAYVNVKPSHGVSNFRPQNQGDQNVTRSENLTQSQGDQISQAVQPMLSQENLSNMSSAMQVQFNRAPLKNGVEIQQRFESKQLQFLKKETTHEELKPILSKVQHLEADATEPELVSPSRQKIALAAQQIEIKTKDVKNNEVDVPSKHVSMSQSSPTIVLSATQVRLIIDNLSRYVKEVSSETTQFKHLKREMPETIKVREPIKIETFKLTVAKEIKQVEQEPLHQKTEKFETTEQLKEAMNNKLAKKTYEQEQPSLQHLRMEQRNVDQVVVRVEQEQRSQNLQTIVETIKQMRETFSERAEIQLSPPSLGKLEIELVKQQDRLTILMRVSTQEAKQMIENSSKELVSRLSSLGFKVEQIEVRMNPKFEQEQTNEERQNNQQSTGQEQQQRKQKEDDEDDKRG
ncbi:flagellar hook-length control protein FliK [Pseudothermotoga sp.]